MEVSGRVSAILARKKISTVWLIGPNAMVIDAIQLMDEKNVGSLPVVDNGTLVGIVSERDYTRKVILKGRSSKETPVSDIMTEQLLTVNPSDSVTECMRIMTEKRVRHLPVLEGTNLVGILSIGDVVNWFISAPRRQLTIWNDISRAITHRDTDAKIKDICVEKQTSLPDFRLPISESAAGRILRLRFTSTHA